MNERDFAMSTHFVLHPLAAFIPPHSLPVDRINLIDSCSKSKGDISYLTSLGPNDEVSLAKVRSVTQYKVLD